MGVNSQAGSGIGGKGADLGDLARAVRGVHARGTQYNVVGAYQI